MRIVIMGTGPFAVPTAQRLLEVGHDIPLVVTRPLVDPQAKKIPPRPIYAWARGHELTVFEPTSINDSDAIERLRSIGADLLFVCDYGQILSRDCLSVTPLGGINLHGSLLPRHRGAAPVQWALLRGDAFAGVTVIHMTPRLDAGPALTISSTEIMADETAQELEPRLATLGIEATEQAVEMLKSWDGTSELGVLQDKSLVTKAPRFSKSDGQLDFRLPADYLVRLVRACQPWPGTFAELRWPEGKQMRMMVRSARVWTNISKPLSDLPAGSVVALDTAELGVDWPAPWKRVLAVSSGSGLFLAGRIQPAGKREMDVEELLRGHPLHGVGSFLLPLEPLIALA